MTKGGAATAGVAAVGLLLAGCNPGSDGVRTEGAASSTPGPHGSLSAAPGPTPSAGYRKVDAVALLKADPKVGGYVKKSLAKPCAADAYPVEVTYASLTGAKSPDVIVNVITCADSVGIGSYVYRRDKGAPGGYENVFADEQPSVNAGVDKDELEVSTHTYKTGDKVCCPSGEDVTTYRWADGRFVEYAHRHTDYSKTTVDGAAPEDGTGSED
ncbi:LppP/LprE family lipoprotein [Streptomyces halobius]|uniref:LppP/LprE family lipoprotein n=1 Tax=Streptomyces halobius TaxID=2879846 RepID=A0ABY4MBY1_9ACTN|nr:LppP/LprE family lipoprotein [Streptomyces halobius]UQA93910.1 LppP/LprE family lipoprotein [Streptomyces halobius]